MTQQRRALVIGGSLGGLFAAHLLRNDGWKVDVFERVPDELAGRGAGIVTHPELFDALVRCGVEIDASIGVEVPGRVTLDASGRTIGEFALKQDPHFLGTLVRGAEGPVSGRGLSPGVLARAGRAGRRPGGGMLRERTASAGRSARRRRRHSLHRSRPVDALRRTSVRRLCGLARPRGRGGDLIADARRVVRAVRLLPAARRADAGLPGGRRREHDSAGPAALQLGVVPAGRRGFRAGRPAHRREPASARGFHTASADPPRDHRSHAARRGHAACTPVRRAGTVDAPAVLPADLRCGVAAAGVRPGGAGGRCRLRCPAPRGHGGDEGGRGCRGAGRCAAGPRRRRCGAEALRGCPRCASVPLSSPARAIWARTCRRRSRRRASGRWRSAIARRRP